MRAPADTLDPVPRLGDDARRLEQHGVGAKRRIDAHGEIRIEPEPLGAIAVALLDAALGVEAVLAHVPFADGAIGARHGIGAAHDADHEITRGKARALARVLDPAEQFVADDEPLAALGRGAVIAAHDLAIGAAHADAERPHQERAVGGGRLRHFG